jgi:outer membrane protein TolC
MQDRHEPSDRFVERLGQEIGAEVRRRNRQPQPAPVWPAFGLKAVAAAAVLVAVSMAIGGAVVAATYQNENREQREALAGVYERKIQLEQLRLDAAKQQLQAAERRVAVGLVDQDAGLEARQGVVEADAQLRIAMLNLEEVRITGRDPRDEVSAPPIPNRDFVRERIGVRMSVAQGALELETRRLQAAERRVSIGVAQSGEVDVLRGRVLDLESAINVAREKISARELFLANKYDSTMADLRVTEIEAEQRYRLLKPQYELALKDKTRIESLVSKGLAAPVEATKANVRVLEIQTELQRAEVEVMIARQRLAERTAGKGGGS